MTANRSPADFHVEEQYKDRDPALDIRYRTHDLLIDAIFDAKTSWKSRVCESISVVDTGPIHVNQYPKLHWIRYRVEPSRWCVEHDGHGAQILIPKWPLKVPMAHHVPASQAWTVVGTARSDLDPLPSSGANLREVLKELGKWKDKKCLLVNIRIKLYFAGLAVKSNGVEVYFQEENL